MPYIGAAEVERALAFPGLVDALAAAFVRGAEVPVRHVHRVGGDDRFDNRLLLMPAWRPGGAIGVKLVTVFPGNAARGAATVGALYVLLDGATGHPRALIDGEALTLRRTAAVSALAARYLARRDVRRLLLIGTGKLAPYMARAHFECAGTIDAIAVWGRRAGEAERTARELRAAGLPASAVTSLHDAMAAADLVTCATTATRPILEGAVVRPGTHVDLVGAFTPRMREADDALVARAALYVDTRAGALAEAGDLVEPIAHGVIDAAHVRAELAELIREPARGRSDRNAITLFKSVGTALADLAAAERVVAHH